MHHHKLDCSCLIAQVSVVSLVALLACNKPASPPSESPSASASAAIHNDAAGPAAAGAEIGKAAPDFSLKAVDGQVLTLSQFKGKTVVLEWFNPECPFVRLSHTEGSLKGLADKYTKDGVVWLAINSGAPGKQGASEEANQAGIAKYAITHPVLLDSTGQVGKQYGAQRTPHIFVVNSEGRLVYRGAIDNSPDAEGKSPEGGKLVNYVDTTLSALKSGAKVEPAETKAYGCSVKYGS